MTTTMKAWQFQAGSGPMPKNLSLPASGIPVPKIKPDEILVENYSTALNPIDYKLLELGLITKLVFGSLTPGMDVCGRIVEVGRAVDNFRIGDMVYGYTAPGVKHGALAQYVPISKDAVAIVPEGVKADDMAAIAAVGATACVSLKPYVKSGDRIFINGGSGGTGVTAIQVAKALGCHVTASCSTANVELCKSLGADTVLDYTKAGIVEQLKDLGANFDLVLDNVGSPYNLYRVSNTFLRAEGKFIQVGTALSVSAIMQLIGNMLYGLFRGGNRQFVFAQAEAKSAHFEQLAAWMKEGRLRAVIDSVFAFEDAPAAYEKLKTGRARGKIVVHIKES